MKKTKTQEKAASCNAFVCRLHYAGTIRERDRSRFLNLIPERGVNCRKSCFHCPVGHLKDCARCCYEGTPFCEPELDVRDFWKHYHEYLTGELYERSKGGENCDM